MLQQYQRLTEAFENRKWNKGEVKFSEAKLSDPHIQKILKEAARITNIPLADIEKDVQSKVDNFKDISTKAPILYGTILKNFVENETFNLMQEHKISSPTCPKFNRTIFYQLVYAIKADHEQFYPLRSFMNHKRLYDAVIIFTDNPDYPDYNDCETACASPKGVFAFNPGFCQDLMEMAHLKEVKPKGKKYECNGGDIPDEYCYIEFVIIHEFMHYTYDDFHYQKVIPNANPDIINWVGDFRTNYLLVKSGYEQLPMGLFNDDINYDRQKSYKEMYDLVESEMKKLSDPELEKLKKALDEMSDEHEPGQGDGKGMEEGKDGKPGEEGEGKGPWKEIDEQNRKTEDQMKNSKDKSNKEASDEMKEREEERKKREAEQKAKKGGSGAGQNGSHEIDYTKIKPSFQWRELIKKFISTANEQTEETYQKPSRRGISGIHTAMQTGAGAMKPGDIPIEQKQANLCFCIDSSGSMGATIAAIYANLYNLLKSNPGLQACQFTLIKFSASYDIFKAIFKGDKAGKIPDVLAKPKVWDKKMSEVFKDHFGSSTNFSAGLVNELDTLLKKKHNVLIFSDRDVVTDSSNFNELLRLMKQKNGKIFIIFDSKQTYVSFLQKGKFTTPYITYFE